MRRPSRRGSRCSSASGLADKAREHPDRLSGGQQQRAAIVRAIATDPEILLLDEITSALDPELVGEVLELVRELADEGATILMATHEMAFARDVAHRVVFLDAGRILEQGPPAEVFANPREERTQGVPDALPRLSAASDPARLHRDVETEGFTCSLERPLQSRGQVQVRRGSAPRPRRRSS